MDSNSHERDKINEVIIFVDIFSFGELRHSVLMNFFETEMGKKIVDVIRRRYFLLASLHYCIREIDPEKYYPNHLISKTTSSCSLNPPFSLVRVVATTKQIIRHS